MKINYKHRVAFFDLIEHRCDISASPHGDPDTFFVIYNVLPMRAATGTPERLNYGSAKSIINQDTSRRVKNGIVRATTRNFHTRPCAGWLVLIIAALALLIEKSVSSSSGAHTLRNESLLFA